VVCADVVPVGLERLEPLGLGQVLPFVGQPRLVLGDAFARVQEILAKLRNLLLERRKGRAVFLDPRAQRLKIPLERLDVLRDLPGSSLMHCRLDPHLKAARPWF
jgi:hypothetical protein